MLHWPQKGHAIEWNEMEIFHISYPLKSSISYLKISIPFHIKILSFYIPHIFYTLYYTKNPKF